MSSSAQANDALARPAAFITLLVSDGVVAAYEAIRRNPPLLRGRKWWVCCLFLDSLEYMPSPHMRRARRRSRASPLPHDSPAVGAVAGRRAGWVLDAVADLSCCIIDNLLWMPFFSHDFWYDNQ